MIRGHTTSRRHTAVAAAHRDMLRDLLDGLHGKLRLLQIECTCLDASSLPLVDLSPFKDRERLLFQRRLLWTRPYAANLHLQCRELMVAVCYLLVEFWQLLVQTLRIRPEIWRWRRCLWGRATVRCAYAAHPRARTVAPLPQPNALTSLGFGLPNMRCITQCAGCQALQAVREGSDTVDLASRRQLEPPVV